MTRSGDDAKSRTRNKGSGDAVSRSELIQQLHGLGVQEGDVLLVHTSYRAVRPVEGGPSGLIDALLEAVGPAGTLVMPSWGADPDRVFDPRETPAAGDLGIVADFFWRLPGAVRCDHPQAFAAIGPAAETITSDHLPLPPHIRESPVGRVYDLDGKVLLIGVGHDANTTLHLAEILAEVPYRRPKHCTVLKGGYPIRVDYAENDHCCERFALVDGWLSAAGRQSEGMVGHARARLARARDIVAVAVEHLHRDTLAFLHPPMANCAECDLARASLTQPKAPAPKIPPR
jgi:aminoglycoside N3'-acetyltransferase